MSAQVELTILAPMYNEAASVASTLAAIEDEMSTFPGAWELLLIDDGSTDETAAICQRLGAAKPWLRVGGYAVNRGRGHALRRGYAQARGAYVVTIDFDLSYDPGHITRIYRTLVDDGECDIVIGSAYMPGGTVAGVSMRRLLISRVGNLLLRFCLGQRVYTATCVLRGYRRQALQRLPLQSDDKELHLEIISKALILGMRLVEIPADLRGRDKGHSKSRVLATTLSHLRFCVAERPVLAFALAGSLTLLFGLILGVSLICMKYAGTLNPSRPLVPLCVLANLSGIHMLLTGIIAYIMLQLRNDTVRMQSAILQQTTVAG